ncbi:hypothetical protein NMY22_g19347 [Coprinellus aureogranulatus]|nr:hypothetical protein NMY22_g19347 [Coprinellus aureogranulatus]
MPSYAVSRCDQARLVTDSDAFNSLSNPMAFGSYSLLLDETPSLFGASSLLSLDINPLSEPSSPPTTEHILTPSPIEDDEQPSIQIDNTDESPSGKGFGFQSNGLLGDSGIGARLNSVDSPPEDPVPSSSRLDAETVSVFGRNGLLGGEEGEASGSFRLCTTLAAPILTLKQVSLKLRRQMTSFCPRSSSSKPVVRAVTFDGKAVFLKKKAPQTNAEASSSGGGGRIGEPPLTPYSPAE